MAPQSRPVPVLLTRPQAQGDRFATDLITRFGPTLAPVPSPLIAPAFLHPAIPQQPYTAIILTSETAAASAAAIPNLPRHAYCVGDRTAAAARAAGFTPHSAKGDANALIALILSTQDQGPFLHLRGADSRGDIAATLTDAGRPTHAAITYDQRPQPLSLEARTLLAGETPVLLPLFSPRTAEILASQGPFAAPLWLAALSPAVAAAAAHLHPARSAIAAEPNADALLTAIATLL